MGAFMRLINSIGYIFVHQDARYDLKVTPYLISDITTLFIIKFKAYSVVV